MVFNEINTETSQVFQELFEDIVENSVNELHITYLDDLTYLYANKIVLENSGYLMAELKKKTLFDLIKEPFYSYSGLLKSLSTAKDKKFIFECKMQRKNGSEYFGDLCSWVSSTEGRKILITIVKNINEHKVLERILASKLDQAYKILNKSSIVALTLFNMENLPVKFATENIEKLTGYEVKEFLSKEITYLECVHPHDVQYVQKALLELDSKDISEVNLKPYRIITKKGKEKIVKNWFFAQKTETGEIISYKSILEDITVAKINEMEIKKTHENLEKFSKSMLSREDRILELKQEINQLLKEAGKPIKYKSVE